MRVRRQEHLPDQSEARLGAEVFRAPHAFRADVPRGMEGTASRGHHKAVFLTSRDQDVRIEVDTPSPLGDYSELARGVHGDRELARRVQPTTVSADFMRRAVAQEAAQRRLLPALEATNLLLAALGDVLGAGRHPGELVVSVLLTKYLQFMAPLSATRRRNGEPGSTGLTSPSPRPASVFVDGAACALRAHACRPRA